MNHHLTENDIRDGVEHHLLESGRPPTELHARSQDVLRAIFGLKTGDIEQVFGMKVILHPDWNAGRVELASDPPASAT